MPTLAPPLGLGPAHPALLQPPHNLGHGGLLHHPQPGEPRPQLLDTCTWIQITELNECRGWQQRRGAHIGDWWQPGLGWAEMNPLLIHTAQPSPAQLDQDGSLNVIWQKVHFCGEVRCSAGRHSTPASQQRYPQ